ncbi:D-alanyl-D-alanine carboxypeptidase family protein [Pararhodobacter sp. SW119]|uniref:D-alanyl-D-alanine carboxypeptidase family protein n=1 Tax=Pararhodobacter sp. SW119 TaxID=2780075 RepID=UPI001ADF6DED|nr:D-alanyl-D-alanine carboxypeptidase family protein [Pararhodobacter sp. SW119]
MPAIRLRARLTAAFLSLVLIGLAPLSASAQVPFETRAPNILVLDLNTGQVLIDRNSDVPLPPASMSKLMTLLMLFESIEDGRVTMDTTWTVSERAHAMGGSSMFLETRHAPTTEDLIRGIAVLSGNDATVVVAEGLAGSEEAFGQIATQRARELGMTNTNIMNASGWPHPQHRMSLRDLATLSSLILNEFPQYYPYLAEPEFTWNNITQPNRLPLIGTGLGMDGLKTGHTTEAGYALTGSALQGTRRIVFVFSGLTSERERAEEAERIINWAFRQFAERRVAQGGQVLAEAEVWMGEAASVPLVATQEHAILVPAMGTTELQARVEYDGPLSAPIAQGDEVARLIVEVPGSAPLTFPLVAGADVARGGFAPRMRSAATVLADRMGVTLP